MNQNVQEIETLRTMAVPDLMVRYVELFGKGPRVKHRVFLVNRIAWRLEENRTGGLPIVAKRKLEELIAQIELPTGEQARTVAGKLRGPVKSGALTIGTTLTKVWRGKEIVVRVVDGGFEYEGDTFRSLTAVAKAVTSAHWNGKLFFGLAGRRKA